MALSEVFELIKQLNNGILKGATKLAKEQGMTGNETIFLIQSSTSKVLFNVAKNENELDEVLVKTAGDIIQGIFLKPLPLGLGYIIDISLITSGNSLGDYLLDYYIDTKNTIFSQGYIYKPEGLVVNNIYIPGQYFRVGTITTPDGRTKIARDSYGQIMSAEVISQSMYESVHPDYNDLYKLELDIWDKIDVSTSQFSPDHEVTYENGVLSVKFPDGHIEAEALEIGNSLFKGSDLNDTFVSNGNDILKGGTGNDTYIASNGDTIRDSDHTGKVEFNEIELKGGNWDSKKELYVDNNNSNITYTLEGSTLTVSDGSSSITINEYDKEKKSLGIILEKSIDIEVTISDVTVNEADGIASLTVSINEKLDEDLTLKINTSDGSASSEDYVSLNNYSLTIPAGEKEATLEVEISDDDEAEETENFTVEAVDKQYDGDDLNDIDYGQGGTVTIEDDDKEDVVKISIGNISDIEGDTPGRSTQITVTINKVLNEDLTVSTSIGSTTISAGSTEGKLDYSWSGDTSKEADEHISINIDTPSGDYTIKSDSGSTINVKEFNTSSGSLTIKDDDDCDNPDDCDPDPIDPLVLDINKDGLISTISLEDSNAYFDLTGDGEKEKVGWVGGDDALLVYDENENGEIDGISEVFGNDKLSGFTELKNKIDSNHDGKVDRQDELFYQLQTWHDYDGDGRVDEGELKSLKEEGVTTINTEVFNTNIEVDGNILTEASKYTDSNGSLELAADLLLQYEGSIFENTDETSLGIEIKEEAKSLPNLKADGYVLDSLYAYSTDEKLLAMAQEFSTDIGKIANNFDEFIAQWSGFYDMAASKGISKEEFSNNVERNMPVELWVGKEVNNIYFNIHKKVA
jgi:hypothetical protein